MEKKVLLVDDEEGIRKVLGISLADSGYEVLTAQNGEEALKVFGEETPPIVLTDIKMPGMDGIALLREIKQIHPETEVIMITGHGDMDLAIKSLQYEAIDFVTKPINDAVLEIALNRAIEKISMREQLQQYTENLEALVKEQSAKLVEAERLAAVGQAVQGLSAAIKGIADDLEGGIRFFNEMPCFVSVHSRDLKIVDANQLYKERLGDRVGGLSWEVYKSAAGSADQCPVALTFQTGSGQRTKRVFCNLEGRDMPVMVHTAPIRNKEGDLELVLEIAVDISEVNRIQEELRTTQQRYQQLFDEVPCYISVQDKAFRLTATNKRFKEDFGDRIGSHCHEVYKNQSEPCDDCPVALTFQDGQSHQSEMVVTAKNGQQYNVLIWTAPIRNAAGEIVQVMEMLTNITQVRQLQDNLTSLGFLISSISHGVKGLLTGLDGGMYLIESGLNQEKHHQIEEGWEVVQLMVDRIRNMVQNILFYAKERELQWETVAVRGFAEDVALIVKHKMMQHGIEFDKEIETDLGVFEIDVNVMRSALINILDNAIEAILADTNDKSPKIQFAVQRDEDMIEFVISDNGIGMDQETCKNVFTLFYSSKGHAGTGLGLYISHRIIQQHGGQISVESAPGEGSRFCIRLFESIPAAYKQQMKKKVNIRHCA